MNKISVIIPNHSNKNIDKLINEVKKFKPLEIIIVNNKSETVKSNNTSDILKYINISEEKMHRLTEILAHQKLKVIFYFSDNDVLVESLYIYNNNSRN